MASLRNFFDQFANKTTLDGNRLDRLIRDVVAKFNAIPPKHMAKRWVESRYIMTLHPPDSNATSSNQDKLPFMGIDNWDNPGEVEGAIPDTTGITNQWRIKGTNVPAIDIEDMAAGDNQYAWTSTLYLDQPTILDGLAATLYANDGWVGLIEDLFIIVQVDDVYLREDRDLSQVAVYKFKATPTSNATPDVTLQPTDNMDPPVDLDAATPTLLNGYWVDMRHMNVPLPAKARVRVSFVVSRYPIVSGKTQAPWALNPWTVTLSVLEGITNG